MAGLQENKNNSDNLDFDNDDLLNDFSLDDINIDDIDIEADNSENIDLSLEDELTMPGDDLDITKDLGLQENLSLSESDDFTNTLDDIDLDIIQNNEESEALSDNFFGVALKEGPKTIISFDSDYFESDNESIDDYEDEGFDNNFEIDKDVVNFNFPEKQPLSVDEEEEEYLKQDIDNNMKTDIDMLDKEFEIETDNIEENINKDLNESSLVSDEELMGLESDISNIEEEEPSVTTIAEEEIPIENDDEQKEDIEYKDISLDEELNYNEYDLHLDDESLSLDDNSDNFSNEDDTLEINIDEGGLEIPSDIEDEHFEVSTDIETTLSDTDFDLNIIGSSKDNILDETLDEDLKNEIDIPEDTVETKSPFEIELSEDFDISVDNDKEESIDLDSEDDEKIAIDNLEMEMIEGDFFPEDNEMPAIDEDILTESATVDNGINISPLNDSESVFDDGYDLENTVIEENIDTEGDLSNINLDEIPSPINQQDDSLEDETIGLSLDELDNILNDTDIIDNEVTIIPDNENVEPAVSEVDDEIQLDSDIDLSDNIHLEDNIDTIDMEIPEENIEIASQDNNDEYGDESETIDLNSFDADLNENTTAEQELIPEEPDIKQISISSEEEDEIYNSLKSEMKTREVEETDKKTEELKSNVKNVLSYLDQLLDALPEEKIKEFAESDTFELYRKLFEELNIKNK